jgi:hypothetical protein
MKRIVLLVALAMCGFSCGEKQPSLNIGLQTGLLASPGDVIQDQATTLPFFENFLKSPNHAHYPGKTVMLFDTVYTSAITTIAAPGEEYYLPAQSVILGVQPLNESLVSLLARSGELFIYRTIIPEPGFKQVILADIASKDSLKIAQYFTEQKLSGFIKR